LDQNGNPSTNNISEFAYVHRGDSNTVEFTYDGLDRLTLAEYNVIDEGNKVFTIVEDGSVSGHSPAAGPLCAERLRQQGSLGRKRWHCNANEKRVESA